MPPCARAEVPEFPIGEYQGIAAAGGRVWLAYVSTADEPGGSDTSVVRVANLSSFGCQQAFRAALIGAAGI